MVSVRWYIASAESTTSLAAHNRLRIHLAECAKMTVKFDFYADTPRTTQKPHSNDPRTTSTFFLSILYFRGQVQLCPFCPRTTADIRGQTADNKYLQLFTPTPRHQKDRRGSGDKLSHTSVLLPATTHAPSSARALNAGMQPNCGDPAPQEVYKLSW